MDCLELYFLSEFQNQVFLSGVSELPTVWRYLDEVLFVLFWPF